ncbi:hypothetical protein LTR37_019605 [Vermiconidia calcicola]|uniref:Uncharacterized protein n=1 Tax=Vermiconidia calcicola TaxID=1690605 RepID=A0ACC3MF07_9PEZI|nr:hypothetical protein LTR37_019605 [Vermiconidia calcicola]
MDPNLNILAHRANEAAVEVAQDQQENNVVEWPANGVSWLWTRGLNACTAIAVFSKDAGALWHFQGSPPLNHNPPDARPGNRGSHWLNEWTDQIVWACKNDRRLQTTSTTPLEIFIVAGILPKQQDVPVLVQQAVIDRLHAELPLPISTLKYKAFSNDQPRPAAAATLEIRAIKGTRPVVYFNGRVQGGHPLV